MITDYSRNCNNFSNDLSKAILGVPIPSYINRCAHIASWSSCFFPSQPAEPTPVRFSGQAHTASSSSSSSSFSSSSKSKSGSNTGNRAGSATIPSEDQREYQRRMRLKALQHSGFLVSYKQFNCPLSASLPQNLLVVSAAAHSYFALTRFLRFLFL